MLDFADNQFDLSVTGKDGATLRDHYEVVWQQTGKKPKQLAAAPMPSMLEYLWELFVELSLGRQSNGFGAVPFSWSDIKAWIELNGYQISPNEIKILKQLDSLATKDRKSA